MAGIASTSMILQLFLLFGQQATSADQVLDRYAAARRVPLRIQASMNVDLGHPPSSPIEIWVDGTARTLFLAKTPNGPYKASLTPNLIREIDQSSKMYDEHRYIDWSLDGLRLSRAASLFPSWMSIKDLRTIGGDAKWELKGYQTRNGIGSDRLHLRSEKNGGGLDLTVDVDSRGFIVGFEQEQWNPMGRMHRRWIVSNYRPRSSFFKSEIELPIPVGFAPYAVDYTNGGVAPGDVFPLQGWSQDIKLSKISLLVLYGENCEPSHRALPWLRSLESRIPITYISDGTPKLVRSALSDPSGNQLRKLDHQGTPTIYLVSPAGKVLGMWMGYDPANAAAVQKEIFEVATGGDVAD